MKAFMTNGTLKFLEQLPKKHPQIDFYLMHNNQGALAYYENSDKRIFSAGRAYNTVVASGELSEVGYIVINNIPIPHESQPLFENRYKQTKQQLIQAQGFIAFRLLKPLKGDMYAIFTQWKSINDYEAWKESTAFKTVNDLQAIKQPAYFANRAFVSTFSMVVDEDET